MPADKEPVTVAGERVLLDRSRPPQPLHKILWTRIESEVQLEAGYFDLAETNRAVSAAREEGRDSATANLYITQRYVVSPSSALLLLRDLQGMVDNLRENGLITDESGNS